MRIAIVPTPIAAAGGKAHGIAGDVADTRDQLGAAWDDAGTARLTGFAVHHALDTFTEDFTTAIDGLAHRVDTDGTRLNSTANTVTNHDGAGADQVGHSTRHVHPYQG